jgi:lysyl-tRNA synthetase class 2
VRKSIPALVGVLVIAIALANLLDLVWPGMADHLHLLAYLVPQRAAPWAHALAGPVAVLMVGLGWALTQRRRAALAIAVGLLGVMAVTMAGERRPADAAACAVLAVLLYLARGLFPVMPPPQAVRQSLIRLPFAAAGAFIIGVLAVVVARGDAVPEISGADVVREALALLTWRAGPADFPAAFHWLPEALALVGIIALVLVLAPLLRRPPFVPDPQTLSARRRVDQLAARHDSGSLSQFVLRPDHHWLFSDDGDAVLAYQVEAGVLLVAADPIGNPDALPGLVQKAADTADRHGLLLGVMAGADAMRPLWRRVGLRAAYLGDEAVVDALAFSLEGRAIRKVRQSVTRLQRDGFTARMERVRDLSADQRGALDRFRQECRDGQPERGFSMAGDRIADPGSQPTWVALAHGPDGAIAGVMHFVPGHWGTTQSLSMMLRARETPNGLMEFLVVHTICEFRDMGVTDVSLNFVTGGRYFREHTTPMQRVHNRAWRTADRWFQIKRLEKFTEKFFPRWDARYVMYPGLVMGYLRVGLAAMWAEGQIARPRELVTWRSARRAPADQENAVEAGS